MKVPVLEVVCSSCLQVRECAGFNPGDGSTLWYCRSCADQKDFKNKTDVLVKAGWLTENPDKKHLYRVEVTASISRTYEIEAEDEEEARREYMDGDLVDEDEDLEDIDSVTLIKKDD